MPDDAHANDDTTQLRGRERRIRALIAQAAARMSRDGRHDEGRALIERMDYILATNPAPEDFVHAHANGPERTEDERAKVLDEVETWLSEYVDARLSEYKVPGELDSYGEYLDGVGDGCDALYGAFRKRFVDGARLEHIARGQRAAVEEDE